MSSFENLHFDAKVVTNFDLISRNLASDAINFYCDVHEAIRLLSPLKKLILERSFDAGTFKSGWFIRECRQALENEIAKIPFTERPSLRSADGLARLSRDQWSRLSAYDFLLWNKPSIAAHYFSRHKPQSSYETSDQIFGHLVFLLVNPLQSIITKYPDKTGVDRWRAMLGTLTAAMKTRIFAPNDYVGLYKSRQNMVHSFSDTFGGNFHGDSKTKKSHSDIVPEADITAAIENMADYVTLPGWSDRTSLSPEQILIGDATALQKQRISTNHICLERLRHKLTNHQYEFLRLTLVTGMSVGEIADRQNKDQETVAALSRRMNRILSDLSKSSAA